MNKFVSLITVIFCMSFSIQTNSKEIMNIIIGSKNNIKINAVKELIKNYSFLDNHNIISVETDSLVSEQPLSLDETIKGAMNRAKNSFSDCKYSIGIESGLFKVPYSQTGYMNICACAIYDGTDYYLGLSSAFECPAKVTELMVKEGLDMNQAFNALGLTKNPKLGSAEGSVGILTHSRLNRIEYTKQSVMMALIKLENLKLYKQLSAIALT